MVHGSLGSGALAFCAALVVGACGGEARAPEPPDPATVRAARGDAAWYLHAHLGKGTLSLRTTRGGGRPEWSEPAGAYSFTFEDPVGSMQAFKALHAELMVLTARDVDRRSERNDREEVRSGAVLISGDSKALWRCAQWVIAATYAITRRFSYFRVETGRWVDVDLPDDEEQRPSDPSLRKVTVLTARLFRDNLDRSPAEQYTKIRWDRTEEEVTLRLDERVPDRDRATASRLHADVLALPRAAAPPDEHAAAWRRVEDRVADLVEGRSPWIAAVKTPYPKGLAVPYADVVAMLDVFQRLGAGRMRIEGSPPPRVEGGSWVFDEPK